MTKKVKKFLEPKTIAVVGASETPGKVGTIIMEKLKKFDGEVIPINIKGEDVFGKKTHKSLLEVKKKPDLVIVATPNVTVKGILEDCGKKKIENVIVITAGFSETGNKDLQNEITECARKYKINLLGPNCFGVANPYLNLDATFSETSASRGEIAFISQSGALWSYLSDYNKIGFSGYVSLGNMADLSFTDFIRYFSKDKKTKKILLYIEKVKDGREFIEACRKCKKEIFAIKAGKSKKGSEATMSHTASLATDYDIYKGAFKQAGIKIINSLADTIGLADDKFEKNIKEKEVAIITNAGGAGTLITDRLEEAGIEVKNIIDLLGTATEKEYGEELSKKFYDSYNQIVVILTPQQMSEPAKVAETISKSKNSKKVVACFLGDTSVKEAVEILKKANIPVYTHCC